jgi:Zn-dependent metalloprotease
MAAPDAAHCLSPQPGTYDDFDPTADVHINSGIPNHAFALFARAAGGNAYDAPIRVWYAACTSGRLSSTATFADFASATISAADQWRGPDQARLADAVRQAWRGVRLPLPAV